MIPQKCAIESCNVLYEHTKKLNSKVSFYCFPKNENLKQIWIKKCNRNEHMSVQRARVCSLHFRDDDFQRDRRNELLNMPQKLRLKKGSIPTLNLLKPSSSSTKEIFNPSIKLNGLLIFFFVILINKLI